VLDVGIKTSRQLGPVLRPLSPAGSARHRRDVTGIGVRLRAGRRYRCRISSFVGAGITLFGRCGCFRQRRTSRWRPLIVSRLAWRSRQWCPGSRRRRQLELADGAEDLTEARRPMTCLFRCIRVRRVVPRSPATSFTLPCPVDIETCGICVVVAARGDFGLRGRRDGYADAAPT
jgi:hypothetical protein